MQRTDLQVIARISAAQKSDLQKRNTWRGVIHLMVHVALIICLMILVAQGGWFRLAVIPLGIVMIFLFTLEHEATHRTPFGVTWLNDWVGQICGLMLCLPFIWFRYFHLAHHKYTNDPARDPELLAGAKPATWRGYLIHISGLPVWFGQLRQLLNNALGRHYADYIPHSAKHRIKAEARIYLLIYALMGLAIIYWPALLWYWIVPIVLGQPFLRLYLLAEHGRCAYVETMLENTRTTYTTRALRWLAWNMPYHTAHHLMPNVPFHKLPALNQLIADDLMVTSDGYGAFQRDYVARFKSAQ